MGPRRDLRPRTGKVLRQDTARSRRPFPVLAVPPPSFVFLTLPTPNAGHRYDFSAFASGTASVGTALKGASDDHTVVVRSTVPPGTTEGLVKLLRDEHSGKEPGAGYALACNPEFLRAASAAEDFRWPWMTVIAARSARTVERLRDLLAPFGGAMQTFTDPASAELVKCAHNNYNATKISFWNEMWLVARRGLELDPIAHTVARSAEGSFNPLYGPRRSSVRRGVPAQGHPGVPRSGRRPRH